MVKLIEPIMGSIRATLNDPIGKLLRNASHCKSGNESERRSNRCAYVYKFVSRTDKILRTHEHLSEL